MLALCVTAAHAAEPASSSTAATIGRLTPVQMTEQWQAATVKFASERQRLLRDVANGDVHGPFRPDWGSLMAYHVPAWYSAAKFGIFIHWGVFSVPGYGSEWYSRNMYVKGRPEYEHHQSTYGKQDIFGYKDLIPRFKAEHFDAKAWARLFHEAGARYVVPVAEHHDGFAMYDSHLSEWTAVHMGPHRDVIGELARAVRAEGMRFGVSSHRAEHDWFFDSGRDNPSDVNDPANAGLYGPAVPRVLPSGKDEDLAGDWTYVGKPFIDDWLARTAELVRNYQPDLIYFDWWVGQASYRSALPRLLAYYYNHQVAQGGAVVNYKFEEFAPGSGVLDIERGRLTGIREPHWQTDTSVGNKSWGYIDDEAYKSPTFIIDELADVVSKNGNLMLNIGPRADGTIPDAQRDILLAIGRWLRANGEAIYDTHPWKSFGEGPTQVVPGTFQDIKTGTYTAQDFRFTASDKFLYVLAMGWPAKGQVTVHAIKPSDHVRSVTLLDGGRTISFTETPAGLVLDLRFAAPNGPAVYAFRLELESERG